MGQIEIIEFLEGELDGGNYEYFTSAEISRRIKQPLRSNVYRQINQLVKYGRVEVIAYSLIPLIRGFRYKKTK